VAQQQATQSSHAGVQLGSSKADVRSASILSFNESDGGICRGVSRVAVSRL